MTMTSSHEPNQILHEVPTYTFFIYIFHLSLERKNFIQERKKIGKFA